MGSYSPMEYFAVGYTSNMWIILAVGEGLPSWWYRTSILRCNPSCLWACSGCLGRSLCRRLKEFEVAIGRTAGRVVGPGYAELRRSRYEDCSFGLFDAGTLTAFAINLLSRKVLS
jgi:hypothetical protein